MEPVYFSALICDEPEIRMSTSVTRLFFLLCLAIIPGCGQKGPLYLPPEPESEQPQTAPAEATRNQGAEH